MPNVISGGAFTQNYEWAADTPSLWYTPSYRANRIILNAVCSGGWTTSGSTTLTFGSTAASTNSLTMDSTAVTWGNWTTQNMVHIWSAWEQTRELTQEERAARAQRLAATEQRDRALAVEQAAARARAEILLKESLSDAQRAELAKSHAFHLETVQPDGSRKRYRIRRGRSGNVDQVDAQGKVLRSFCIHPIMPVPDADTMLAQKLLLEADEATFLSVANHIRR